MFDSIVRQGHLKKGIEATFLILCLFIALCDVSIADESRVHLAETGISNREVAVIVNDLDPLSVKIARYYRYKRGIPAENMIHVKFPAGRNMLSSKQFTGILKQVYKNTPKSVQAYALTWALPYRVGCMSITTAFALGYHESFCAKGCKQTLASPYFNSQSKKPYSDLGMRPTMAIASTDFDQAKRLIDRGVASDKTSPEGTAFLVSTSDKQRNVRSALYPLIYQQLRGLVSIEQINTDYLERETGILFYFTGIKDVEKLDTLKFLPGAIADHLTSTGGVLDGYSQMSILRWLEAGATGSYGAVTEPCNFPAKFPNPGIAIASYATGDTLIEAYWKSVLQPGQGIFVGEPLAKPFGGYQVSSEKGQITVETRTLKPGVYLLLSAENEDGPFRPEKTLVIELPANRAVQLPNENGRYYRITRIGSLSATGAKAISRQTPQ